MQYDKLDKKLQEVVFDQHMLNLEQTHYQVCLALKGAQAIGNEAQVAELTKQLEALDKQHEALLESGADSVPGHVETP